MQLVWQLDCLFNVKYSIITEEFKGILEDCTRKSKETLQTIDLEESKDKEGAVEEDKGYT